MAAAVAFLLKGYPRLSETFIAQEIEALEARGFALVIVSLRHPTDRLVHPVHRTVQASVLYLPEYLYQEPARVWRAWRSARRRATFAMALRAWVRDLVRDPTANRFRRFGQALVLARELPDQVRHLHAHYLHTPASVARYASFLTGLPWSCSAHAKDIWTTPNWEKREKLKDCRWMVTCTAYNHGHLSSLAPAPERVELVYHGLNSRYFPSTLRQRPARDGGSSPDPVVILSVGRAVEKKGYQDLVGALALLPRSLHWRFVHIGGGPLLERLQRIARANGIVERISWLGARSHGDVLRAYGRADLFALACRVAKNGDRDGLPNVLMEAQSQALPCLATEVSAIPELITDGVTGLLAPSGDVRALATALQRLIVDPVLRRQLGEAGWRRVRQFSFDRGVTRLAERLAPALQG
jgi:glycosyltransferase involved in cell wall biosynthesis